MFPAYALRFLMTTVLSSIFVYCLTVQATEPGVVMLEDDASLCTIMRALSPEVAPQCDQVRFRSIVMVKSQTATPDQSTPPPSRPDAGAQPQRVYAFATRIQFAWDSARLAPESHPLLHTLAQVLKDDVMANKVIQIEGHTDSAGSVAYNQRLSAQRAAAVQQFLHTVHGVPLQRIPIVGKGKAEPYDPQRPFDAVNRRVQFVNLTDSAGRR